MGKKNKVSLERITQDNFRNCIRLQTAEDQQLFVANNANTIAWAYVDQNFTPFAICDGETVVGLLAIEDVPDNEPDDRYWVPRFMIGAEYQGKGYGRAAMGAAIAMLAAKPGCERIRLSVWPENRGAMEFYRKIGFIQTDEWLEDEIVMDYHVTTTSR